MMSLNISQRAQARGGTVWGISRNFVHLKENISNLNKEFQITAIF